MQTLRQWHVYPRNTKHTWSRLAAAKYILRTPWDVATTWWGFNQSGEANRHISGWWGVCRKDANSRSAEWLQASLIQGRERFQELNWDANNCAILLFGGRQQKTSLIGWWLIYPTDVNKSNAYWLTYLFKGRQQKKRWLADDLFTQGTSTEATLIGWWREYSGYANKSDADWLVAYWL